MRDFTEEFPHLNNFVGFFFNQDYRDFGRSSVEVVDTFRKMVDPDKRRRVLADLDRFLQSVPNDEHVAEALAQFGLAYDVSIEQPSERAWVRELRRLICESLVN